MIARALGSLLQWQRGRRFAAFEQACRDPDAAQARVYAELHARNGQTALAKRLGVDRAPTLEALRATVPLVSYEDLQPEIDAMLRGEPAQLCAGRPLLFATTSGTTGRTKYLPIDADYLRSFQEPMHLFLYRLLADHPGATRHRVLYLVGSADGPIAPCGVPTGTISGFNHRNLGRLLKGFHAVPYEPFVIADPVARAYTVARLALVHEVSLAVAITTHPLAELADVMEQHGEALLRDLRDGTLRSPAPMTDAERRLIGPLLTAEPARARVLEARLPLTPRRAWPELALVSCWHHAGAGSHKAKLDAAWGPVPMRSALYSATEGWLNVPTRDADPGGILAITSNVVEFEVLSGDGKPTGRTMLPHEVEPGASYGIVLCSGAGVWRYRLGDEVRVTGRFHATPEIAFVQKLGSVLNLHHEAVREEQVQTAMTAVGPRHGVSRWVVGPAPDGSLRYRFLAAATGAAADLARDVDAELRKASLGYDEDRGSGLLLAPEVVLVGAEVFTAWERARAVRVGAQAKPVVLVTRSEELPTEVAS